MWIQSSCLCNADIFPRVSTPWLSRSRKIENNYEKKKKNGCTYIHTYFCSVPINKSRVCLFVTFRNLNCLFSFRNVCLWWPDCDPLFIVHKMDNGPQCGLVCFVRPISYVQYHIPWQIYLLVVFQHKCSLLVDIIVKKSRTLGITFPCKYSSCTYLLIVLFYLKLVNI